MRFNAGAATQIINLVNYLPQPSMSIIMISLGPLALDRIKSVDMGVSLYGRVTYERLK